MHKITTVIISILSVYALPSAWVFAKSPTLIDDLTSHLPIVVSPKYDNEEYLTQFEQLMICVAESALHDYASSDINGFSTSLKRYAVDIEATMMDMEKFMTEGPPAPPKEVIEFLTLLTPTIEACELEQGIQVTF